MYACLSAVYMRSSKCPTYQHAHVFTPVICRMPNSGVQYSVMSSALSLFRLIKGDPLSLAFAPLKLLLKIIQRAYVAKVSVQELPVTYCVQCWPDAQHNGDFDSSCCHHDLCGSSSKHELCK